MARSEAADRWAQALAQVLREARESHGISQRALSRRIGRSSWYIGKLEAGQWCPSVYCIAQVVNELGLTASDVIADAEALLEDQCETIPNDRGRSGVAVSR